MPRERCVHDPLAAIAAALEWWSRHATEPTSSLTGGGAIAALERAVGRCFGGRALALPSGSAAVRVGLQVLGVQPGATVMRRSGGWFGDAGIVRSVGATLQHRISVVAPHVTLIGTSDEPDPDDASVDGAVLVDATDLHPPQYAAWAGRRWDALALSFGPGKPVDAGEGGMLILRERGLFVEAVARTQHPVRQQLAGITAICFDGPFERIHPAAAVTALHLLVTAGAVELDSHAPASR